jgi:hypothetical protein
MDEKGNPLVVAVAPETRGAIVLGDGLPTVPQLLSRYGLGHAGAAEAEAWWDSWSLEPAEGAHLRERVYPSAAARLNSLVGMPEMEDLLARGEQTLVAAGGLEAMTDSPELHGAVARARTLLSDARRAMGAGDAERSLELFFRATDTLWELTPTQVAMDLLNRAEEALRRNRHDDAYSEEELIRIRRLIHGASEALDAGDYPGAIRRAYYACQLLGASPP